MTDYRALSDADLRAENDALTRACLAAWRRKREADKAWDALCEHYAACKLELALREVTPRAWEVKDDTTYA